MAELNKQTSVVDFLKSGGQDSSFGARKNLAVSQGIVKNAAEYTGSASQNISLLNALQSPAKGNVATVDSGNISSLEQADSFINEGNVDQEDRAEVRTSFQRSEDFFTEINDLVSKDLGDAPDAPSFTELFNSQREKFGLDGIEQNIAEYTAEKREIEARLRQRTNAEEGKSVALNVIQGRVDETTRQERENLDFVEREIAYNVDRANSAYNAINTMISLTEKDFNAASKQYENEYSRRKEMYSLATNLEQKEYDRDRDAQEDARANGEIIVNTAIMAGSTFEDLDADTQLALKKMGLQSGLGSNIFEDMITAGAIEKGQEILTTVTAEDKNSVTVVYADGSTDVIATRGGAKPSTKLTDEQKQEEATQEFDLAIEYADGFAGTDEELKRDLLKNSDLTATDINSIIATRSVGEEKIQTRALSLVEEYFDKPGLSRILPGDQTQGAFEKAKEDALNDIDEYVQEVDGRELTPADEDKLREKIKSVTLSDINTD